MSANCKFSNKYLPLVLRQHQNLSHDPNYTEGEFVDWMKNTFTDAEEILNKIKEGNGDWASLRRPAPTSILTKEKVPTFSRNIISTPEITPSIDQLYVGRADLRLSMEQRFAEDIVKLTVFNLDANDGQGQFVTFDAPGDNGISTGNQNILNYKNSLLKAMTDEMYGTNNNTVTLTADMSAQEFDGTINKVLQDYRMYISTHEDSGTAYTEFAIMQNFDNLLKARAPFISFNEDMDYDFADKYEYKGPSVQHYTGFTRDESASIAEQDSDLAKILLQVIPEVDDKGNIIQGSFIGLSGFNSAMLGLKKAILYSPASFSPDVRDSYFNGLNINMSKLIQEYINALLSKNNTLPAEHKTFLISKLRGIQKYIYDSRFEPIIKNMFTQMFFKTETVSYRAYSYDEDSRAVQARSLTSHFSDIQKLQLEDAIQGAAHLLRSNGTLKKKIKDKYRVQINNGVISLSDGSGNKAEIVVINKNNKLSYKCKSGSDHFVSQIISDVLFMTVPDTYVPVARQIDGKSDITVLDDFATPLGIVLSNIFTNQGNSGSVLDLKPYNTQLSNIGRKLSVIYGSETKNVVRNLSGSKIPLYQLTNMTYNTMSILEDCKEWAKDHPEWEDIYKDQLFIRYPGLLVAPQVRNEIRIGDQIKPSSKLTVKELVNISALEDFYKPLLQDGIIYLQNATFADKSTHYLIGYNLNAVKNGDKTLRGSLKDVVDGKSSSPLIEFIRKERARRINAITNNVIADYNKATARYGFVWGENSGNVNFTSLEQIDDFLQNAQVYTDGKKPIPITEDVFKKGKLVPITEDILKEMFESAHIPLEEEVHYTKPKLKSRGKIRMNETFLNYHKTFNDPKLFEERINKSRRQFIENIKDIKWNKFDSGRFSEIFDTYRQKLGSDWYDLNSGDIKLYNGDQLHPILEAYFLADILLSKEYNAVTIGEVWMHPNKNTNDTNVRTNKSKSNEIVNWSRYSDNGYEVSSSNDSRFSAKFAKFKPGTVLFGHDVGGRTIESVYQHGVKQNDWVTNNNNKTGAPTSNVIIKGNTEDDSYRDGYLPLWQEWASQNPKLIEELREKVRGKVLTDKFASTRVSQARALADILNSTFDPNKEEGTYEEFSEANRLIAQIKRSVAFGATYHPFAQNQPNGVASEIDIAVISDMPAKVFTPNGEEDKVDSMDGSGVADALQARFESNSLIDARVGDNKKTIMMDVDKKYGKPILLKWAVYALTNQYRRNGAGSFASAEELCRKMRSRQLMPGSGDRLVDLYNERINSGKKIIFENNDTGEKFRLESIEKQQDGTYRRRLIKIKDDGDTEGDAFLDETVFSLNTLYSMDQILGGAWTGEFREDGKWIYNEANNDILEELLTRNNSLKSGFIAYAVNKSAIKVGSGNVNDKSVFSDDNAVLKTIKMRTKYGGVQMDADHELDEAEVTEMTQMISSLIEDQHYPELVKEIYTDIGNVVERHMRKYVKELSVINDESESEEERKTAKDKLHQILGEALIAAFNTGTKDTLGLAQAFVQKASAAIAENKEFHIPFSSATINGQFISEVMASINRGGIRHKYEGLAGVLNPSFNMMQYYRVYNDETGKWEHRLYPQLAEYMRRRAGSGSVKAFQKNYEGFIDWNTENNPFVIDSISGRPITVNDIDFEDTVLVTELIPDEDGQLHYGNTTQHYINSYVEYDKVKTLLRNNPNYQIRLHTGKGRNLRGADTRFTVGDTEYSYYDLDSVKASFYLNRIVKNIKDKPLRAILDEDQINFLKTIYGETLETIDKTTAQRYLKVQQTETQNVLKAIETGKEFYLFGRLVTASSWRTRPPEIIMGRYQMNKLGIDDTVHQYQISDSSFFKENLRNKYAFPNNSDINEELYDVILYDGNKKFFVKIGKESDTASIYSKYSQVSRGNKNFTLNGGSVWYNGDEVMDSNGVRFYTHVNETGEQFNLISVDSIEEYNKLLNSGIFDDFQSYNYQENNLGVLRKIRFHGKDEGRLWMKINKNGLERIVKPRLNNITLKSLKEDENIRCSKYIEKKAKDLYEAYRNGRYFVGARIPTQAMQSFMPMECIAWADTDENIVYVPAMQTYLEGSDYRLTLRFVSTLSRL